MSSWAGAFEAESGSTEEAAPAAPEGLPDLDNAEAQTEASAQKAFEAWTGAHRALLGLLYPDSPTLIEAILSVR